MYSKEVTVLKLGQSKATRQKCLFWSCQKIDPFFYCILLLFNLPANV